MLESTSPICRWLTAFDMLTLRTSFHFKVMDQVQIQLKSVNFFWTLERFKKEKHSSSSKNHMKVVFMKEKHPMDTYLYVVDSNFLTLLQKQVK